MQRWATFDCYGTLIDWNGGIGRELERLFGPDRAGSMLHRYHEVEPRVQREDPKRSYREVMAITLSRLGPVAAGEEDALGRSLPSWQPFTEAHASLTEARKRGWKLAILSNTDRELIDASIERIGVPFDDAVTASEIGSYKPVHGHWTEFADRHGNLPDVHVGASLFHDMAPANELGIPSVWVNRLGEARGDVQPTCEIETLEPLPAVLAELAPA